MSIDSSPSSRNLRVDVPCPGHNIDDYRWRETDSAYITCWKQLTDEASSFTGYAYGTRYHLTFDWSQIPQLVRRMYKSMDRLESAQATGDDPLMAARFPRKPATVPISSNAENPFSHGHQYLSVAEIRMHDVFVIANLSAPGSADFSNVSIRNPVSTDRALGATTVNLPGVHFEIALADSNHDHWPAVGFLDARMVSRWYFSIRNDLSQVPKNPSEKVVFALMHMAKIDMSPIMVIWLFYALETLFDTKAGENFRVLLERISLILNPNEKQKKSLKSNLRQLYTIRSALVHGGYEISHPTNNEVIDERLNDAHWDWIKPTEVGFRVLLSSIQQFIKLGYSWPIFTETMSGPHYEQ